MKDEHTSAPPLNEHSGRSLEEDRSAPPPFTRCSECGDKIKAPCRPVEVDGRIVHEECASDPLEGLLGPLNTLPSSPPKKDRSAGQPSVESGLDGLRLTFADHPGPGVWLRLEVDQIAVLPTVEVIVDER